MNARGLTLLELLAALALLGITIAGASEWMVGSVNAERRMRGIVEQQALVDRAAALLRRDLREAMPGSVEIDAERGMIQAIIPQAFGTEPGWRRVEWRFDETSSTLQRGSAPADSADSQPIARDVLVGDAGLTIVRLTQDIVPGRPSPPGFQVTISLGSSAATILREITQ